MKICIVIPAHNEELYLAKTVESLINQSLRPFKLVLVNDNSTDTTGEIMSNYADNYEWIEAINLISEDKHMPGSKIVNAFLKGFETIKTEYDIICKFDADLIFEKNYLSAIVYHFDNNPKLGMVSGFCYIKSNNNWVLEDVTNKSHIRGALKAYRRSCYKEIGGLKPTIGWDTVDELLASYYNWETLTDDTLHVKHLKVTGKSYSKGSKKLQGEAMYKMRMHFVLTFITGTKMALKKNKPSIILDYMIGYFNAMTKSKPYIVDPSQGKFIRKIRWKGIFSKLF